MAMSEETLQGNIGRQSHAKGAGRPAATRHAPHPALVFGYLGVMPLLLLPILAFFAPPAVAGVLLTAQILWAALGLVFLGAIHWGFQLTRARDEVETNAGVIAMGLAGLPMLIAFLAVLMGGVTSYALFLVAYPTLGLGDELAQRHGMAPGWYAAHRGPLTWLALLSMLLGVAALFVAGL